MNKIAAALMLTLLACLVPFLVHGLLLAHDATHFNLPFRALA